MALDIAIRKDDTYQMRTAEVEVNKMLNIKVNDREHKAFKRKCLDDDRDMSEVLREFMREYVSKKK
jgi:hypothetical protein